MYIEVNNISIDDIGVRRGRDRITYCYPNVEKPTLKYTVRFDENTRQIWATELVHREDIIGTAPRFVVKNDDIKIVLQSVILNCDDCIDYFENLFFTILFFRTVREDLKQYELLDE